MKCSCPTKFDDHSRAVVRASLDQSCPIHGARTQALPHCSTCTCGVGSQIVQTPAGLSQEDRDACLEGAALAMQSVLVVQPDAWDEVEHWKKLAAILRRLGGQTT